MVGALQVPQGTGNFAAQLHCRILCGDLQPIGPERLQGMKCGKNEEAFFSDVYANQSLMCKMVVYMLRSLWLFRAL